MCEQASDVAVGNCDPIGLSPQLPHTIDPRSQRLCVDFRGGQAGNGREVSEARNSSTAIALSHGRRAHPELVLVLAFENVAQNLMVECRIVRH